MEINNNNYFVGVLNPSLRVFDVIMETKYGTSYNSYLVKGENKTALIETAHLDYFDYLIENINKIMDPKEIDYLIMNHNEPDHSGSIKKLLEIAPNITVVSSAGGGIYLKNIVNETNMKIQTVKTGDSLDLGGKTLEFINAPFLHWPDSMFTWLKEDKIMFTCDFLGCHFCEPQMFDYKTKNKKLYLDSLKYYYDAIFSPFAQYVQQGLEKIKGYDIDFVCPSHGPILTKDSLLKNSIESYDKWSKKIEKTKKDIPIFYCSAYGNTKMLAEAIKEGIDKAKINANVTIYNVIEEDMNELAGILNNSDAFLLGSPTINKDALPPIWQLLCHIDAINIQKRPVGLFGSFGWSGEATPNLSARLNSLKVNLINEPLKVNFVPTDDDLKRAEKFGEYFAAEISK